MKFKLLFLFLLITARMFSQENAPSFQPPKISPLAPDVTALFKFTEIPVSNTTGIPNISIPIHEIKLKNYSLPININYHSSGIIIDEVASKVGLGWMLNAGGMIYQDVMGKPDNIGNRYPIPQDRMLNPEVYDATCANITNEDYHLLQNFSLASSGSDIDSEPDIYFYSVGDKNGKFFFDNDNVAHTIPESDVKIIRDANGIIMYDEMGVKYTYRTTSLNRSMWVISYMSIPSTGATSGEVDSYSYYLTEIETPEKEKIFFTYDDYIYEYKNPVAKTWKKRSSLGPDEVTSMCNNIGQFDYFPLEIKETIENSTFIMGKSIKKILTNNQSVDFVYENCPRLDLPVTSGLSSYSSLTTGDFALKKIKISDYNSLKRNEFIFNYSYFNLNNYQPCISQTNIDLMNSYRLKLESVVKNNIETYSFQYYLPTNLYYSTSLPDRLSTSYDNWNRFNFTTSGDFAFDSQFNLSGVNRDPDLVSTLSGVLKQIKYPTGGVTRFEYELNTIYESKKLPPTEKIASLFINGTEEITGQPNEAQYLSKHFKIDNLCSDIKYFCYANLGEQTITDWVNIDLYDHQTKSYFHLPGCNNQAQDISNLTNGEYTLYVSGTREGGGANFVWNEANNNIITKNHNIGGLRIKEIASFDKEEDQKPYLKKIYSYASNEDATKSSGKVLNTPRNTFVENRMKNCCPSVGIKPITTIYNYRVIQNKVIEPLSNLNGYHIMYTDVQIYDENDKSNGVTTFKYNFEGNTGGTNYWPITPPTNLDFLRGDLIEKIDYSFRNGTLKKIQENLYEYYNNYDGQLFNPTSLERNYCIGLKINTLNNNFSCIGGLNICIPSLFELGYYKLSSVRKYMSKQVKTIYDLNGNNPLTTTINYNYNNLNHSQLTSEVSFTSEGKTLEKKFYYAKDPEMSNQPFVNELKNKNMVAVPLDTQTYNGIIKLSEQLTVYDKSATTSGLLLPKNIYVAKFPNTLSPILDNRNLEKKITYDQYDDKGNLQQYTPESGVPVSIIWGYNKTQPIAKIENATYGEVASYVSNLQAKSDTGTEADLLTDLNALRTNLPNAMVTTYTYIPLVGVSTITDPKGYKTTYTYDNFGRLKFVKDKDLNVLQKYCYNYKGQQTDCSDNSSTADISYKSVARSGSFAKNNCAAGGTGSSVVYNQSLGAVISSISQADADANGLVKFNNDGQNNANTNGTCTYSSIARSGSFTRNNCDAGGTPSSVIYTVNAGTYTSTVSQEDADNKAQTDVTVNGQTYSNTNGICTFKNVVKSGTFTKNDCTTGYVGSSITYTVNAGIYSSTVSQADADSKAQVDVNTNGQNFANTNGVCPIIYKNVVKSGTFKSRFCTTNEIAQSITYSVAAGTYSSSLSQEKADALALADIAANGQNYANTNGICKPKSGTQQ